jgi:hypothetical protein
MENIYKPGTILNFAYREGFAFLTSIGNLIKYQKLGYTHSAIVIDSDDKGVFVAEALDNGIAGSYYENWWLNVQVENRKLAIGTPIKKIDKEKLKKFFLRHEGEKYEYMALWNIMVYWFTGKQNVYCDDNTWICSEFVAEALKEQGMDIVKELNLGDEEFVSPMDLFISDQIKWAE